MQVMFVLTCEDSCDDVYNRAEQELQRRNAGQAARIELVAKREGLAGTPRLVGDVLDRPKLQAVREKRLSDALQTVVEHACLLRARELEDRIPAEKVDWLLNVGFTVEEVYEQLEVALGWRMEA